MTVDGFAAVHDCPRTIAHAKLRFFFLLSLLFITETGKFWIYCGKARSMLPYLVPLFRINIRQVERESRLIVKTREHASHERKLG